MIDTARRLFAERGYHGTSVTAICAAIGRSDGAFYQYFPSKHELFKMFFEELGKELVAHFELLEPISGDAAGLARLGHWMRGLGEAMGRYSTVFMEWPTPEAGEPAAQNPQERYFTLFADALSANLAAADTAGLSSRVLTLSVLCLTAWGHVVRDAQGSADGAGPTAAELDEVLTRIVHDALFPRAPAPSGDDALFADGAAPEHHGAQTLPGLRRAPATPAAHRTIERITSAAAVAFGRYGLTGTSVNAIIAEAGVAHGTFYQYWPDRAAIFATLVHQATVAVREHFGTLLRVRTVAELAVWLDSWLDVIDRHGVTLHAWNAQMAGDPEAQRTDAEMRTYLEAMTGELLNRTVRPYDLPPRASAIALWTILTEFPYMTWGHLSILTRDEVRSAQLFLLVRGFFD